MPSLMRRMEIYGNSVLSHINFITLVVLTDSFISSFLSLSSVLFFFSVYHVSVFVDYNLLLSYIFAIKCTASIEPKQAVRVTSY